MMKHGGGRAGGLGEVCQRWHEEKQHYQEVLCTSDGLGLVSANKARLSLVLHKPKQ